VFVRLDKDGMIESIISNGQSESIQTTTGVAANPLFTLHEPDLTNSNLNNDGEIIEHG